MYIYGFSGYCTIRSEWFQIINFSWINVEAAFLVNVFFEETFLLSIVTDV